MLGERARKAAAIAEAIGGPLTRHRLLSGVAMLLLLLAVGVGSLGALARGGGGVGSDGGNPQAGAHQFSDVGQPGFCNTCHSGVHPARTGAGAPYEGWLCVDCHAPASGEHAASFAPSSDLTVVKVGSPDSVQEGANVTYFVTVTNLGPEIARAVRMTDTLPSGVTLISATPSQGICVGATCDLGDMLALGSASVSFIVQVDVGTSGIITNTACAMSASADPDPTSDCASVDTTVLAPPADLAVAMADSPDPVEEGANVTYLVTVDNLGPGTAEGVTLTDTLPAGVTLISATPSQGTCVGASCDLGDVLALGSASVSFIVQVDIGTSGIITNTACVLSASTDPVPTNDCASTDTTVLDPPPGMTADLLVAKADSPDPVDAGANVTYLVTVDSLGPDTAQGVILTDTLPAGVTLISATPSQGTCVGATCDLGDVLALGSASVTFIVQVDIGTSGIITNTVCAASASADPVPTNDCASTDTTVLVPVPTQASFTSVADTYARQDNPNNSYGADNKIEVRSDGTQNRRAFVMFDVSSIPSGSIIDSATLTLCARRVPDSTRIYDLHLLATSWAETTLTWVNQPADAQLSDSATTPASLGCMTWTVTADVQSWTDGTANNGWRVSDSIEGEGTRYRGEFHSKESSPAPTLDVTYHSVTVQAMTEVPLVDGAVKGSGEGAPAYVIGVVSLVYLPAIRPGRRR